MTSSQNDYQRELSLSSPILLDSDYKRPKVEKMLSILAAAGAFSPEKAQLAVDIGCSRGFFCDGLAPHFVSVIGIDIDSHALALANREKHHSNLLFLRSDSQRTALPSSSVDLVICNHVYEHVPSAEILMDEILRILKPGGICYLGAASRLIIMEPHYHLPFLSWLPKSLAHWYMRLFGRGDYYYEKLRTYWSLRNLIRKFTVNDFTLEVLRDPDRFCARDMIRPGSVVGCIPIWVWELLYPLLPTYILILQKRENEQP